MEPTTAGRMDVAPSAAEPIISLRNIEKSFPQGVQRTYVLRRVTLDIRPGEFVSIMGPSGAGKSTLLHILGMHDAAWTGEYHLHGQPVHRLGKKERGELQKQHIGFVFQSYHLLDDLTVAENLDVPLSYRDMKKSEREASSPTCSTASRSSARRTCSRRQLSGGQQQLVAVARAHHRQARRSSWPTSRPATCTPPRGVRSWSCSARSTGGRDDHPGDALGGRTPPTATASSGCGTAGRWTTDAGPGHAQARLRRPRACSRAPACSSPTTSPTSWRRCACCSRPRASQSRRRPRRPRCSPRSRRATSTSR